MFEEKRRESYIQPSEMPAWHARVKAIQNPIRRDLHWFLLFSGLRRNDAVSLRWENVDLDQATVKLLEPKGGRSRAFRLPLPDHLVDLLRNRKNENEIPYPASPYVFPAKSRSGHIAVPKQSGLPSSHVLRHTYATAAQAAGLGGYDIKLLLNHALPKGDVTAGYIHPTTEALRKSQQSVSDYLWGLIDPQGHDSPGAAVR